MAQWRFWKLQKKKKNQYQKKQPQIFHSPPRLSIVVSTKASFRGFVLQNVLHSWLPKLWPCPSLVKSSAPDDSWHLEDALTSGRPHAIRRKTSFELVILAKHACRNGVLLCLVFSPPSAATRKRANVTEWKTRTDKSGCHLVDISQLDGCNLAIVLLAKLRSLVRYVFNKREMYENIIGENYYSFWSWIPFDADVLSLFFYQFFSR